MTESTETAPDPLRFREVIGHFASGVAVITACAPDGSPRGLTANAVASLSLDPLLVLVCFDNKARTLPLVKESQRFGINVLKAGQEEVALRFASKLPEEEKFAGMGHCTYNGAPVLDDTLAWLACDLQELVPGGDHVIGIGAVTHLHAAGGNPLLFYRGAFGALAVPS